jgi:hypothetical protein
MMRHPTSAAKPTTPPKSTYSIEKMGSRNEAFSTQDYDSTWLKLLHPLDEATRKAEAELVSHMIA